MEQVNRTIGKFWFPVTCLIISIVFLLKSSGQTPGYKFGVLALLAVGIISLLFVLDVIKKKFATVLIAVFAVGAGYYTFLNYDSVDSRMEKKAADKIMISQTIQRLKDFRAAQEAYRETNGWYTEDTKQLMAYVKNGTVPQYKKIGAIPDSVGTETNARKLGMLIKMPKGMTEQQIINKGLIVRDTIDVPVMDAIYTNEVAIKKRKFDLDIDKIIYAPASGQPWDITVDTVDAGGVKAAALMVVDPKPDYEFRNGALQFGTTEDTHLNGNWKED